MTFRRTCLLALLTLGPVQAQGGGSGLTPPRPAPATITAAPPTLLTPLDGPVEGRTVRAVTQGRTTTFTVDSAPRRTLSFSDWPAALKAPLLVGWIMQADQQDTPEGRRLQLTFRRPGAARPAVTLLTGVDGRQADPLPGTALHLKTLGTSSARLGLKGTSRHDRTLRPGERARWTAAPQPVCVTLLSLTPVRADTVEAGRPPEVTGHRAALLLEWPGSPHACP